MNIALSDIQTAIIDPTCHSLQLVKKHYGTLAKETGSIQIKFDSSEITLSIPEDGLMTKEGWRITPFAFPTVSVE